MLSIRRMNVLGRTYRNFGRYRQIVSIIFRYGFEDIVERLKVDQYVEAGIQMISRNKRENIEKLSRAERLRLLFEELGPTFIKFAQILSTRPDLVPPDIIAELRKLQDEVPPFPYDEAKIIIEDELGGSIDTFFSSFDEIPIASASIAQVHKAVLKDGEVVAVKVQRPGIRKTIEMDLEIMLHMATLMERNIEELNFQKPTRVIEEFERTIERELDFNTEAANVERTAEQFENDETIYIPKVYSDFSSARVLTMEYIDGIKVSEIEKLEAAGLDPKIITFRGATFVMRQVFEFGFFHADPHPGNVFVLPDNVICPIDFGMTGSVDKERRDLFVDILETLAKKDSVRCARLMLQLGEYDEEPDIKSFERETDDFMEKHLSKSLKNLDLARVLQDLLDIATKNRIRIPPIIFLMTKAFAAMEGIARLLDPDFDMIAHAAPFVQQAKLSRYSPFRIADKLFTSFSDSLTVLEAIPHEILQVIKLARHSKLTFNMEMRGLDNLLRTLDQVSNRLSFSVVIAALIVGSAYLLAYSTPPIVFGVSLIGIVGFSIAGFLGVWLLIAILRRGML